MKIRIPYVAHHLTNVKELPMFYGLNNVGYMVSSNQTSISGFSFNYFSFITYFGN